MSDEWPDWAYIAAAGPSMKKALDRIHALSVQDDDPDELLESIRIEAVNALREAEREQG